MERCARCGQLRSECSDPKRVWYPQRSICYPTMERDGALRTYERIHASRPFHNGRFTSWAKNASVEHPYHLMDGVVIYAAPEDVNPGDKFLTSPDPLRTDDEGGDPVGEQA